MRGRMLPNKGKQCFKIVCNILGVLNVFLLTIFIIVSIYFILNAITRKQIVASKFFCSLWFLTVNIIKLMDLRQFTIVASFICILTLSYKINNIQLNFNPKMILSSLRFWILAIFPKCNSQEYATLGGLVKV